MMVPVHEDDEELAAYLDFHIRFSLTHANRHRLSYITITLPQTHNKTTTHFNRLKSVAVKKPCIPLSTKLNIWNLFHKLCYAVVANENSTCHSCSSLAQ